MRVMTSPFHDLDVVDVEEDFHPRRADLVAEFDAPLDRVGLVVGVAFHRDVDAAVQHFQARVTFFFSA